MMVFLKKRVSKVLLASLAIAMLAPPTFFIMQTCFAQIIFWTLVSLSIIYTLYFVFFAIFGICRQKEYCTAPAQTHFALVAAARNEAAVIGKLLDSLHEQNYPNELYDIYVAPNGCTDNTQEVAQQHGAKIFTPTGVIHSKGEALHQVLNVLLKKNRYDAVCVFDADNLVHPDFLQKMNDVRIAGAKAAQGFRDSKNPTDTPVSTSYSIFYWFLNRFYNGGRAALGLSSVINGTGFMVDTKLLKSLGGWNTQTISEDYEFSAQCVLAGERIHYVAKAIIYDEQPLTFGQSWKQRRRWATGMIENFKAYFMPLIHRAISERSKLSFDLAVAFFSPAMLAISTLIGAANTWLMLNRMLCGAFEQQLIRLSISALTFFVLCTLMATFIIILNRKNITWATAKGICYFPLFIASCTLIGIISFFHKKRTWDIIEHTRSMGLQDMCERSL